MGAAAAGALGARWCRAPAGEYAAAVRGLAMHIDIRVADRLRGKNAVDLAPALSAVANAVKGSTFDPTKLRFVFDWVQYRTNFREPVSARSILPAALSRGKNGASD